MSYERAGLGFQMPERNPLTGEWLEAGQSLVTGPQATGPRVSVVQPAQPTTWPPWITANASGVPVDSGTVTGGTWDGSGAQSLPDVVTTALQGVPWWVWPVAAILAYYLVFGKRRSGPGNWD